MKRNRLISNKRMILKITLILLLVSIFCILVSSIFIKKSALNNLAEDDAYKTSELIFETINTRMQEGWDKNDLNKIINRLEYIRKDLKVNSYRNKNVEEIFGVIKEEEKIVDNDILIQKAMNGEKQFIINDDGSIRYLYPLIVKNECITCHYNTKVGDVNGVLDISYPPSEIKISLDSLTSYFIIFFIISLFVFFFIFFIILDKKMVKPIVSLSNRIIEVRDNEEFYEPIYVKTNIKEIKTLEISFNKLLKRIKIYYEKILNNIYYDSLTSLPNIVKLEKDIKELESNNLIILCIDDFKTINNFYGRKIGTRIINILKEILINKISKNDILYKLHSDEFAILPNKYHDLSFCEELVRFINDYKFYYEGTRIYVSISLGVTFDEKEDIIEKTAITLKNAIKTKRSIKVFDKSFLTKDEYTSHINWVKNIDVAILENKIIPYFQPIKDAKTNEITKYETLARLEKDQKIFTPDNFIDISKKSKQYGKLTRILIKKTFEYFKDKKGISFSLNFSVEDILNKKTIDFLFQNLKEYNIGDRFILELLETEELDDFNIINEFITNLKKYNVKIAIDDFGSGYSNFTYLTNLNIDFLKFDSSLIENIHLDSDSLMMVKNINTFAHQIGLKTIAEKVHCEEIESLLIDLNIDYLQGYYIGKPKENIIKVY